MAMTDEEKAAGLKAAFETINEALLQLSRDGADGTLVMKALSIHLGSIVASLPANYHSDVLDACGRLVVKTMEEQIDAGRGGTAVIYGGDKPAN